jgi:hypothetical protein
VVGEYTLSGSGTVVAMQTSPALITPALGVATGTSLALNGATIGSTFLAVTGSDNNYTASIGGGNTTGSGTHGVGLNITGTLNTSGIVVGGGFFMNVTNTASDAASSLMEVQNSTTRVFAVLNDKVIVKGLKCPGNLACRASDDSVIWQGTTAEFQVSKNTGFALAIGFGNAGYSSCDTILQRRTTATLNLGLADVNTAPVAQTITVQRPLAGGTSDVNGADFTIVSGLNKGSGTPGKIIFQSSIAGSTGTVIATPAAAITIANSSATGIAFNGYGAGAMSTDASGNITATSDENVKDIQGAFTSGLAELMQIKPIRYKWKPSSGMETEHEYAGFGARNVNSIIPLATGQNRDGSLTLQDRALLAACVNAIKELAARV